MDFLTTAADAILNNRDVADILTPSKNDRPVFRNLTNILRHVERAEVKNSSMSALFKEKIESFSKRTTPGKRKKNFNKYGDENNAPSPKTPKNSGNTRKTICSESPLTPMSNLKMLTRIASMEDPLPSKKTLFQPPKFKKSLRRCFSENETLATPASVVTEKPKFRRFSTFSDLQDSSSSCPKDTAPIVPITEFSRRDKSLGLLCERFLEYFPMEVSCLETPRRLVIDDVASLLGTERRRVYDIINVLECLNMASRVQKNMYVWMGKQHLATTLSRLKALGNKWKINIQSTTSIDQAIKDFKEEAGESNHFVDKCESRKDKSLGVLCQKFLMLFLTSDYPHTIPLDTALKLLMGKEGEDFDKLRTRGRRIYDIANVLISLKLLMKNSHSKAFQYIGPTVDPIQLKEDLDSSRNQIRMRHSLLPPLFLDLFNDFSPQNSFDGDSTITPSNIVVPVSKKGKPRKLDSEFIVTNARRSIASGSVKPDVLKQSNQCVNPEMKRHASLQDICQVAEYERERLKLTPNEGKLASPIKQLIPSMPMFTFSRFQSPRMALNFDNMSSSPPSLTSQPPSAPQVNVQSRFFYHNVSSGVQVKRKPVIIIQKGAMPRASSLCRVNSLTPSSTGAPSLSPSFQKLSTTNGNFKVYTRPLTECTLSRVQVVKAAAASQTKQPVLIKSMSMNSLPTINLNTLSRSHYKTVVGSDPDLTASNSQCPKTFRLLINSGPSQQPKTFVRINQESSTDNELENIFGDSFKFTKPKNIANRR